MKAKSSKSGIPLLEFLTPPQMKKIHDAALTVLSEVGSEIRHEETVALLESNGCRTGSGNRVHIPADLIEWAVDEAPSKILIYNKNGEPAMNLEDRNVYFGTGSDCQYLIDGETGRRKEFLYRDVENAVRVADALPNIDFVMGMGLASDIPEAARSRMQFAAMLKNTIKPMVVIAEEKYSGGYS